MERANENVDDYLASIEGARGEEMRTLDVAIREQMPGVDRHLYEGKLWGGSDQQIVGYGVMDHQNRSGDDVEWFVVGLASQKDYISMYVNAVDQGAYLLSQYKGQLGKAKTGSASISFGTLDDVDFPTLMDLVRRAGQLGST
ncbi:MAG TPA: DUF1801 domain-containing protein [Acidimicrobiia bacterium]|nr:DUF1801 domain-containing protein [Acidimicrobiia bacterium]